MTHTPDWALYQAKLNERPALIAVDRAAENIPRDRYPYLGLIFLGMPDPGPQGLGTKATSEAIGIVEEHLVPVCEQSDGVHVGRVRTTGDWQVVLYFRNSIDLDQLITDEMEKRWPNQAFFVELREDLTWAFFREVLAPSRESVRWIETRRMLEQLREKGDVPHKERLVRYYACFHNAEERARCEDELSARGFELLSDERQETADLVAGQTHDLHLDTILGQLSEFAAAVEGHGGGVDGWEAEIRL